MESPVAVYVQPALSCSNFLLPDMKEEKESKETCK